jgi:hypothetical protein
MPMVKMACMGRVLNDVMPSSARCSILLSVYFDAHA